eukprot:9470801-Pyramimonas_sp.AAC.1
MNSSVSRLPIPFNCQPTNMVYARRCSLAWHMMVGCPFENCLPLESSLTFNLSMSWNISKP